MGIEDAEDPRFGDLGRDVGDGAGMPRVEVGSDPLAVAVRVALVVILVVIAGLFGSVAGIAVFSVAGWPTLLGALLGGAVASAVVSGAVAVALQRWAK